MNPPKTEPDLERIAGHLKSHQRRKMAKKLERWARQLQSTAATIEYLTATELPYLHPSLLEMN